MSFDLTKVNWDNVEASAKVIVTELAKGTPSPLDDMLAPLACGAIVEYIKGLVTPAPVHAFTMPTPMSILDAIRARGFTGVVPGWLLSLLQTVGPIILQALLGKFFPLAPTPAA